MTQHERDLLKLAEDLRGDITVRRADSEKLVYLESLVRQLLNDVPTKCDWLDPQLEESLRTAVNARTPASNHRALLNRWALTTDLQKQRLARKHGRTS
jgi:hypothetical protein